VFAVTTNKLLPTLDTTDVPPLSDRLTRRSDLLYHWVRALYEPSPDGLLDEPRELVQTRWLPRERFFESKKPSSQTACVPARR